MRIYSKRGQNHLYQSGKYTKGTLATLVNCENSRQILKTGALFTETTSNLQKTGAYFTKLVKILSMT